MEEAEDAKSSKKCFAVPVVKSDLQMKEEDTNIKDEVSKDDNLDHVEEDMKQQKTEISVSAVQKKIKKFKPGFKAPSLLANNGPPNSSTPNEGKKEKKVKQKNGPPNSSTPNEGKKEKKVKQKNGPPNSSTPNEGKKDKKVKQKNVLAPTTPNEETKEKKVKLKKEKSGKENKDQQTAKKKNKLKKEVNLSASKKEGLEENNCESDIQSGKQEPDTGMKEAKHIKKVPKTKNSLDGKPKTTMPVRSLSDEEYETLFDAVLKRVMEQPGQQDPTAMELITSKQEDKLDIKTEVAEQEDNFEALSHLSDVEDINYGAGDSRDNMGEANEDPLEEDNNNEVEDRPEEEGAEQIQMENEITPTGSDEETKPAIVPVKRKNLAIPKKKLKPKQLNLGKETSPKVVFKKSKHAIVKPKKKTKKISKKNEMLNREIPQEGTWVQCVNLNCLKWRHLKDIHDPSVLPERWTCDMNSEPMYNSCDLPEEEYDENIHQETFIYTHFSEGSVVWAKMVGYPWWPAMIEIDPDFGEYFEVNAVDPMLPTHYHVVFFDTKVSRAWIRTTYIRNFSQPDMDTYLQSKIKGQTYRKEIEAAKRNALEALEFPLKERVKRFSFSARFKGSWGQVKNEDEDPVMEDNFWKKMKNRVTKSRKRKIKSEPKSEDIKKEENSQPVDPELQLDETTVEEMIDNAESILNSADDLCSLDESLMEENKDDPEFELAEIKQEIVNLEMGSGVENPDVGVDRVIEEPEKATTDSEAQSIEKKADGSKTQKKKKKLKPILDKDASASVNSDCPQSEVDTDSKTSTVEKPKSADEPKKKKKLKKQANSDTIKCPETENTTTEDLNAESKTGDRGIKKKKVKKDTQPIADETSNIPQEEVNKSRETDHPAKKPKKVKKFKIAKVEKNAEEKSPTSEKECPSKNKKLKIDEVLKEDEGQEKTPSTNMVGNLEATSNFTEDSETEQSQSILAVKNKAGKRKADVKEENSSIPITLKKKKKLKLPSAVKQDSEPVIKSLPEISNVKETSVTPKKPVITDDDSDSDNEGGLDFGQSLLANVAVKTSNIKQSSQLTQEKASQDERDFSENSDPFDCDEEISFAVNPVSNVLKSVENSDPFETTEE